MMLTDDIDNQIIQEVVDDITMYKLFNPEEFRRKTTIRATKWEQ